MTNFEIAMVVLNVGVIFLCGMGYVARKDKEEKAQEQDMALGKIIQGWFLGNDGSRTPHLLTSETKEFMAKKLNEELSLALSDEVLKEFRIKLEKEQLETCMVEAQEALIKSIDKGVIEEITRTRMTEILKLIDVQAIANATSLKASAAILQLVPGNQPSYERLR